jgi:Rps23 Pro-64 3,4-dihydroxylase Tpa1-like proline 4-hydroxylase
MSMTSASDVDTGSSVARLPMPPYRALRDFLDAGTHAALLEFALANEARFYPTRIGRGYDPGFRISLGLRDFKPLKTVLRARIRKLIPQLIAELRVDPFEHARIELQLVAHGDGAFFKRHIDTQSEIHAVGKSIRVISGVYYFFAEPKGFTGGALRLYRFGGGKNSDFIDIEPEQNMLLIFPSWAEHEVMPVASPSRRFAESRFAVNCWVHR